MTLAIIGEFEGYYGPMSDKLIENASDEILKKQHINKFMDVYDTNEAKERFLSTEGVDNAQARDEGGEVKKVNMNEGYDVQFGNIEYSLAYDITSKAYAEKRDSKTKMAELIAQKAVGATKSMARVAEIEGHRILNQAFTTASTYEARTGRTASIVCPDLQPVISASHAYKSGETFSNLIASQLITLDTFKAVESAGGVFKDGLGNEMPLNFKKIVVKKGSANEQAVKQILNPRVVQDQYRPADIGDTIYEAYDGWTIIATPYLTNTKAFFFMVDFDDYVDTPINENPFFLSHFQSPQRMLTQINSKNFNIEVGYNGLLKAGVRNLPIGVMGGLNP